jgi:hypothetical protein
LRGDDHGGIATHGRSREFRMHMKNPAQTGSGCIRFNDSLSCTSDTTETQALVSFKKYMPPPLPYFKVNICLFPLPHFASIFFAYLCNYLYFKGLLYIWEEMIMVALLHMAGLEKSECIWKIQRKPEVAVSVSMLYPFQWLKFSPSHVRCLFLSNSSEGGPVGIFKCGIPKEKYLGSVTI